MICCACCCVSAQSMVYSNEEKDSFHFASSEKPRKEIRSMSFVWRDYSPETMGYIEDWLDEGAVKSTGLDEGFRAFYEYWASEDGFVVGENYWCIVVFQDAVPVAVIAFCRHECNIMIMEMVVQPEKRGQGKGSKILKELLESEEIIGTINTSEAVIYPDNTASQKAFENAGFKRFLVCEDQDGVSLRYIYRKR